jgi:hypothetical protein
MTKWVRWVRAFLAMAEYLFVTFGNFWRTTICADIPHSYRHRLWMHYSEGEDGYKVSLCTLCNQRLFHTEQEFLDREFERVCQKWAGGKTQ